MFDLAEAFGCAADGTPVPGNIRISARARRVSVIVHPDRVDLVVPVGVPLEGRRGALAFLESKKEWVRLAWERARTGAQTREAARPPAPRYQHGSTVLHGGRDMALSVVEADVRRVRVEAGDGFRVSVPRGLTEAGRERSVAVAVRAWAWARLLDEARRHAAGFAAHLGQSVTDIRLTRARTRWGSCSATGVIRVNVALAAAPPDLLEYLVAHEVAHLRWRGHGPRFYATLARLLPDFQERRTRLRAFEREHPYLLR